MYMARGEVDQDKIKKECLKSIWILHMDRVSNSLDSRAGLILKNFEGVVAKYALYSFFRISIN